MNSKGWSAKIENSHSFNSIGMRHYLAAARSKHVLKSKSRRQGRHRIVASGEIFDGHQPPGSIGGESTSDLLRQARYDNAVKAVVLRVDSPGGSEFASEKILREVQALRKAGKPVVVSMSSYAASGGYYIAAAANQIFASPDHAHRIDRRVFLHPDLSTHAWRNSASKSTASAPRRSPATCASTAP